MKKFLNLMKISLILLLMPSCSSLKLSPEISQSILAKSESASLVQIESKINLSKPDVPFNPDSAFFPLRKDVDGLIYPSRQWRVCKKSFIWCLKWEVKKVYFKDLEWFLANGYGLSKRRKP
jgi:hypothetical protein